MKVSVTQRWLGMRPYVLLELDDTGEYAEIELGGAPTKEEAEVLFRSMKRSIRPLRAGVKQSIEEPREQS